MNVEIEGYCEMSISRPSGATVSADEFKTTRRGLVAAVAVLATIVGSRKADALARPPSGGGHNCFLRGTRILAPAGEVNIEDLAVGDLVATIDGSAKPIKSMGRWSFPRTADGSWPAEALPIKVTRSALGPSLPHRDLYLSPYHCLYLDGLLVPVAALVNGRSIVRCTAMEGDTIEYFHFELEQHDVILSEGAPAETMVDVALQQDFAPRIPGQPGAVMRSRLRSAVSPWIDRRHPGDVIWERLAARAELRDAA
jgi:Hint domain-containing protein